MAANTDMDQFLANLVRGPSAAFAALFIASAGVHAWQSTRYRCWSFTWGLMIACLLIAGGFIAREWAAFHSDPVDAASVVQGLFYSSTPMFTLPLYIYTIHLVNLRPHRVRVRTIWIFVGVNTFNSAIFSIVPQGAVYYYSRGGSADRIASGLALLQASQFLQLFLNAACAVLLALYLGEQHRKGHANDARDRNIYSACFAALALACLVLVRNLFRTIQLFCPPLSDAWTVEAYFWVFEAAIMLAFTLCFHVMHPSRYLKLGPKCCTKDERADADGTKLNNV